MRTSPYVVPEYRGLTIVTTALSRDQHGELVHAVTYSITLSEQVRIVYELVDFEVCRPLDRAR
jgi:hypothetical protein